MTSEERETKKIKKIARDNYFLYSIIVATDPEYKKFGFSDWSLEQFETYCRKHGEKWLEQLKEEKATKHGEWLKLKL